MSLELFFSLSSLPCPMPFISSTIESSDCSISTCAERFCHVNVNQFVQLFNFSRFRPCLILFIEYLNVVDYLATSASAEFLSIAKTIHLRAGTTTININQAKTREKKLFRRALAFLAISGCESDSNVLLDGPVSFLPIISCERNKVSFNYVCL